MYCIYLQVTIETLRLVECLLGKPAVEILDSLVLKYLAGRRYFKQTTVQNGDVSTDVSASRDEEGNEVNDMDRIELEKIVNRSVVRGCWLPFWKQKIDQGNLYNCQLSVSLAW